MSGPAVSVVTPTHNRCDSILRLLDRLRDGTCAAERYEVIVVVDGCVDDTMRALSAASYPFRLRVIEQWPGRGAAMARTVGTAAATGDLLIFVDDDIEPFPALIETHLRLHAAHPDLVVVGAPVPARPKLATLDRIAAWGWWEQQFEHMAQPGHRFTYDEVFSGVLSVRTERFRAAGGFHPEFDNCRDDSELGYRLFQQGTQVAFARAAGGWHHEVCSHTRLLRRKRAEGRADVLLAQRHPELWPVLRLARPLPPATTPHGGIRRLAFAAPWLGDLLTAGLRRVLPVFERVGFRGTWRRLDGAIMYYNYWRGVAGQLRHRAAFDELAGQCTEAAVRRAQREEDEALEIDLAAGLDPAARAIDARRPAALRLRYGAFPIGLVGYQPGAEPWRGRHLPRLLATALSAPLGAALTLAGVTPARPSGPPGDSEPITVEAREPAVPRTRRPDQLDDVIAAWPS